MTTTVKQIKEREAREQERILEKKQKAIKKIAKRILTLRARGVDSFKFDSRLGKKVYELDGFCWWHGENTLSRELYQLGIELSKEEDLIKIQI